MDQLIEMYVEDRSKLNSLFLSHDNRNDQSSSNNNGPNQPPDPPLPPNASTNHPNNSNMNSEYFNPPDTSNSGEINQQPQQHLQTGDNRSTLSKNTHKHLIETQSEPRPFPKMSFNLVEQTNDQNISEPNTPVSRFERPMQRQQSDLLPSRIIATSKHTPLIRIEEPVVSSAQFRKQLQELQRQHQSTSMHSKSSSLTTPQTIDPPQQSTPTTQPPNEQLHCELPLSLHPVTSTTLDYSKRAPFTTISHSFSFPTGTSAIKSGGKSGQQCKHCKQTTQVVHSVDQCSKIQLQPHPSQRTTFYRQATYPHSSTLFTQAFTHSQAPPPQSTNSTASFRTPLISSTVNTISSSSLMQPTTQQITIQQTQAQQTSTTLVHHSNHQSADHI